MSIESELNDGSCRRFHIISHLTGSHQSSPFSSCCRCCISSSWRRRYGSFWTVSSLLRETTRQLVQRRWMGEVRRYRNVVSFTIGVWWERIFSIVLNSKNVVHQYDFRNCCTYPTALVQRSKKIPGRPNEILKRCLEMIQGNNWQCRDAVLIDFEEMFRTFFFLTKTDRTRKPNPHGTIQNSESSQRLT